MLGIMEHKLGILEIRGSLEESLMRGSNQLPETNQRNKSKNKSCFWIFKNHNAYTE
jgi:hypothetical protein